VNKKLCPDVISSAQLSFFSIQHWVYMPLDWSLATDSLELVVKLNVSQLDAVVPICTLSVVDYKRRPSSHQTLCVYTRFSSRRRSACCCVGNKRQVSAAFKLNFVWTTVHSAILQFV